MNQINQNYYLSKLNITMETFDLISFQSTINEVLEHQNQILSNKKYFIK